MKAEDKTKEQLINELTELRRRVTESGALEECRKRVEEALHESEERYRRITGAVTDYIFTVRIEDGHPVETVHGPACIAVTGYPPEEYAYDTYLWFRMVHEEDRAAVQEQARRLILGQDSQPLEHRILRKDGVIRWVKNTLVPNYDTEGKLLSYDGLVSDITERKQAEEALRESEAQKQAILDASVDMIMHIDREMSIVWANKTAAAVVNKTPKDLIGYTCHKFFQNADVPCPGCPCKKALETGNSECATLYQPAMNTVGESYWEHYGIPLKDESGQVGGVIEIARNVTEKVKAEHALVRANEDWENTFDAITDMVMLLDSEHQILRANKTTAETLNTTKENLVGKKCYEVVHGLSRPIRQCPLVRTMKTLGPHTKEIVIPTIGGTFICSTSPIVDHAGKLIGYTHTLKDITESKRLESKLQQAQKMEAIGTLAGGIAHDFNNLLTGILGNASLMFLGIDSSHPNHKRLKRIEKMVISGVKLTGQLLGYARKGRYEVKPIDLNQLVKETSDTFSRTRKEITIHREFAKDLFAVEADQGQIEQVLLNLFVNAADAMPGGGDLFLMTMNATRKDMKRKGYDLKPGNYVLLMIADKGMGMDKSTMERIFDPFFTTKEMGRGTGLGLASTYGIIKGHGGHIDVESKKGHGTTFRIYLPASKKKVQKVLTTTNKFSKGTGTILLVDDEDLILDVGKELLEAMGYRALTAKDGKEAIHVYKKNRDEIDIVLLDMVMPNMGGSEAYDRMKEINPNIKVLLSSGYSIDGQATEILERGCNGFIQKPFNINDLSEKIREILGRK
jgi:two-component system cell cycle sensor histidine kinase/response regulator CckA